jgi:hypothetical protein
MLNNNLYANLPSNKHLPKGKKEKKREEKRKGRKERKEEKLHSLGATFITQV